MPAHAVADFSFGGTFKVSVLAVAFRPPSMSLPDSARPPPPTYP